jgi:transcriptional regulator with XRE-family HTH domain
MSKQIPNNFADVVHATRVARGWTQAELAKLLAVTNVTISRWEKGRVEPSASLWEKFLALVDTQSKPATAFRKPDLLHAVDFLGDGLAVRPRFPRLIPCRTSELRSTSTCSSSRGFVSF